METIDIKGELTALTGSEETADLVIKGGQRAILKPAGKAAAKKAAQAAAKKFGVEAAETVAVKAAGKAAGKVAAKKGITKAAGAAFGVGEVLMAVDAAPVAVHAAKRVGRVGKEGIKETGAALRKGRFLKAAKEAAKGTGRVASSAIKGTGQVGIAAFTARELAEATYSKEEKEEIERKRKKRKQRKLEKLQKELSQNPRRNPQFRLNHDYKHPQAFLSFNEFAEWRESPLVYPEAMMTEAAQMDEAMLRKSMYEKGPMSWIAMYELAYRKGRNGHAINNPLELTKDQYKHWFEHVRDHLLDTAGSEIADIRLVQPVENYEGDKGWIMETEFLRAMRRPNARHVVHRAMWSKDQPIFAAPITHVLPNGEFIADGMQWFSTGARSNTVRHQSARRNPRREDVGLFQNVLAHLRAIQWLAWTYHWQTSGPNYYGDHLLLQRLYEGEGGGPDINASIDALGERLVAHFGTSSVDPGTINFKVQEIIAKNRPGFEGLLDLEDRLRAAVVKAWKANQQSGDEMSLGLDDYLMALANERETVEYLLQQRLRKV